jgi:tetratricopeptide (TPR) repeat protein
MPPMPRADWLRSETTAPALIAIAVLLAWFGALGAPFQFDDYNVIVSNPAVHSVAAWLESMPGIRPLLKLSYALNWSAGESAFGFRFVNMLVHAANAILVFLLLRDLRPGRRDDALPFFVAMLFALHPVQTEAVTYVSGRSVSLMALFYLGSLFAWVHAGARPDGHRLRTLSLLLFGAALLVKETAITLPVALLLVDSLARKEAPRQMLKRHAPHWILAAACLGAMALLPAYRHLVEVSLDARPIAQNLLTQAQAIGWLAGQLAMPWRLNIDPDLPLVTAWTGSAVVAVVVIAALVAGAVAGFRRWPWPAFGVLWFFLHLAPTNSWLPRLDVANDRQLYLAGIGVFVVLAAVVQWLALRSPRRWVVHALAGLLLLALGSATVARNQDYASEAALWEDTARKSPLKPRVLNNLGWAYQREGRYGDARQAYLRALEIDPDYWRARINLSTLPEAPGSVDEAH